MVEGAITSKNAWPSHKNLLSQKWRFIIVTYLQFILIFTLVEFFRNYRKWRIATSTVALLLVLISVFYTRHLVQNVAQQERQSVDNYIRAFENLNSLNGLDSKLAASPALDAITSSQLDAMMATKAPLILVSARGEVVSGRNFTEGQNEDLAFLQEQLKEIQLSGRQPLVMESDVGKQYVYYAESGLIKLLRYYPVVMGVLVASFILIGFLGFRSEKESEQNRVWAGMAKETAHQLGTPMSGMMAWLEHLRMMRADDDEVMEIVDELDKDVSRLQYVADRFSKIGSQPELELHDLGHITQHVFRYISRRAPRRVEFHFPEHLGHPMLAHVNVPLFEWVMENLLRNALDAIGKQGKISADFAEDEKFIYIDISDTGKGIPDSKFRAVFRPGYTTKQRGWGLGLSLAKRIMEKYHNGKIFVKESVLDKGTTFRLQLPKGQLEV